MCRLFPLRALALAIILATSSATAEVVVFDNRGGGDFAWTNLYIEQLTYLDVTQPATQSGARTDIGLAYFTESGGTSVSMGFNYIEAGPLAAIATNPGYDPEYPFEVGEDPEYLFYYPATTFRAGDRIGPSEQWGQAATTVLDVPIDLGGLNYGKVPLLSFEPIIGVKIALRGETHFGWIELMWDPDNRATHYQPTRWAYETEPNTPITAGIDIPEPGSPVQNRLLASGESLYIVNQFTGKANAVSEFNWHGPLTSDWRPDTSRLWTVDEERRIVQVDLETGEIAVVTAVHDEKVTALAFDVSSERLFASDFDGGLYEVDLVTGALRRVNEDGNFGYGFRAMAFDRSGTLYGIRRGFGQVSEIDVDTATVKGIAIPNLGGIADLALRPDDGVMFATDYLNDSLYTLDLESGVATIVGRYGVEGDLFGIAFLPIPEPTTLCLTWLALAACFSSRKFWRRAVTQPNVAHAAA